MHKVKTPPSLKWLITKKARISGEINLLDQILPTWISNSEHALKEAELRIVLCRENHNKNLSLVDKLSELKNQLQAIETAFTIHDIQINTSLISPIRTNKRKTYGPYGSLTRGIYQCLRLTNKPTSTKEITSFILITNGLDENTVNFVAMTAAVRKRLGRLVHQGKIERLHSVITAEEGMWEIPSS